MRTMTMTSSLLPVRECGEEGMVFHECGAPKRKRQKVMVWFRARGGGEGSAKRTATSPDRADPSPPSQSRPLPDGTTERFVGIEPPERLRPSESWTRARQGTLPM